MKKENSRFDRLVALRVGDHLLERMGAEQSDEKMMAAVA
jgi:hypothetical protein